VRPGRAAVLTEEDKELWDERGQRLDFGERHLWFCRPFRARPSPAEWLAFLEYLTALHEREPFDLFVVDPLSMFLAAPSENEASVLLAALTPLRQLSALGLAVLLLHHPRKQTSAIGCQARGSGVLPSLADTLIEMSWVDPTDPADRRRRLAALSRHRDTPRSLMIELSSDGTGYAAVAVPDPEAALISEFLPPLLMVLEDAPHPLTREQILQEWPGDFPRPGDVTLWRVLTQAVGRERIRTEGSGRKHDPFRYWLPEMEAVWKQIYGAQINTMDDTIKRALYQTQKWQEKFLGGLG
jgi:hypothetical protein